MSGDAGRCLAFGLLLCVAVLAFAGRDLSTPGLYYDEAIQAAPAAEFLREGGRPLAIPGATSTRWLGGWLPLMTQPYMSALKSQLLIPVFAVCGAGPATLRLATLVAGCAGLLLCMFWVRRVWGTPAALLTGVLLASDPSFLFVTRHDWGSVSLALVCRGGGLWLLASGWGRRDARVALGGLLLGLGVTNKIDAAPFLVAAAGALVLAAPAWLANELRQRPRQALLGGAGLLLGALPMLATLPRVLGATRGMLDSAAGRTGGLGEKLETWQTFLDGSHFQRLMLAGGRFDALGDVEAAAGGVFAGCLVVALGVLATLVARDRDAHRRDAFALLATVLAAALLLAVPRAARIHHVMNVMPLPQLVVALAALHLWRRAGLARGVAVFAVAAAVLGNARVDLRTFELLQETRGLGRWSSALADFARELPAESVVVSVDWGFHAPLQLLRPELALEEPVWRLAAAAPGSPAASLRGAAQHVYLAYEPAYAVYESGGALLEAAHQLGPELATIETRTDGGDAPVFHAVRFARPHRLVWGKEVEVQFR